MTSSPDDVAHHTRELLTRIAADLSRRFAGVFAPETVERTVFESYTGLLRTARVRTYLPALAEHFAADRLTAMAQAKGALDKPVPEVLFVCAENAGRSQLAAALLRRQAGDRVHVRSAGSMPAPEVSPTVAQALAEIGVDLADPAGGAYPKPLTDDVVQAADVVITMGCGDACPLYPGKRYLDWDLPDPKDQGIDDVRAICAEIDARVSALLDELLPRTAPRN